MKGLIILLAYILVSPIAWWIIIHAAKEVEEGREEANRFLVSVIGIIVALYFISIKYCIEHNLFTF